jgi:DNA polymerase III delta prime subunit
MEFLNIHEDIYKKLDYFIENHKIPNIIFHGPSGSGKRVLVDTFIKKIYNNNKELMNTYVMSVNCAHGKGIKFIRDDLKFFSKTHINNNEGHFFKSIILLNADKLTTDAQSALRRCIELFSHTTRFFIIVEDKYKLLKPILSRFCEIYIKEAEINGKPMNLYEYNIQQTFKYDIHNKTRECWLHKKLETYTSKLDMNNICNEAVKLYEKSYCAMDIMKYIEHNNIEHISDMKKFQLLICFHKIKKDFRNEKLLIVFILNFIYLRSDCNLENITFM